MSRSTAAKSRAEKGGKSSSAATPAVSHEIVPGKYTDQDWNACLDHEEGDEFVLDIVGDVCSSAIDIIFQNYIEKQLVPYTVVQARDAIVQIIEWQFLARDNGESSVISECGWQQDEEPEPAITDCWAQGSVPHVIVSPRTPRDIKIENLDTVQEDVEENEGKGDTEIIREPTPEEKEEKAEEIEEPASSIPLEEPFQEEPDPVKQDEAKEPKSSAKPKIKFKPYRGKLKSGGLTKMAESLEETEMELMMKDYMKQYPTMTPDAHILQMPSSCHALVKLQNGRPPGKNREVLYDDMGNVVGVVKIDPERLPAHKVRTKFHVIDPEVDAAQKRLDNMRTGRHLKTKRTPHPPSEKRSHTSSTKSNVRNFSLSKASSKGSGGTTQEGMAVLPPPLIESMRVAPGVVVREGDRVKKGPKKHSDKVDLIAVATKRGLRPISMGAQIPTISLSDLLDHQTPVVKPIVDSRPVPPIASAVDSR
ncbi:hypothetical protein CAPTEDRAFT_218998 [Capitella teleta]|uniref:Uncharacterized protein n=1 Tax=Capitella teleta TaxID=283909 RepID=R7UT02_CAPTE|nr:hypothetical protein CAPTEDRAFT_218998 [Capitella teleta]|eukprot:ELU06521.1 hypothetical protein CAPTEDRAFT_218998 [Capitella teleta]